MCAAHFSLDYNVRSVHNRSMMNETKAAAEYKSIIDETEDDSHTTPTAPSAPQKSRKTIRRPGGALRMVTHEEYVCYLSLCPAHELSPAYEERKA